jgi:nucleoside-diphosphate-sugar epimerase
MTLLLTGGTGLLGLHLVRENLLVGRHVTVLTQDGARATHELIEHFLVESGAAERLPARPRDLLAVVPVDLTHHSLGLSPTQERALAGRATALWRAQTPVLPGGRSTPVPHTTVSETENLLRFAALMHPVAPLRHVSTAFVAGRYQAGVFREQHSAEVVDFTDPEERAEHTAEGLVRRWVNRNGRGALIVRPGVLIPGPATAGCAEHPLGALARTLATVAERVPARSSSSSRMVLRIPSEPRSFLNVLQADWAAAAMVCLADRIIDPGTRTVHVVHPADTPVRAVARAIEDVLPVRLRMTPHGPADLTHAERAFHERGAAFLPYLTQRRRFDGGALREHGVELDPPVIDRESLRAILAAELSTRDTGRAVA